MYVIIGRHFVPLEGKCLLIALAIVRVSIIQKLVIKLSRNLTTFSQQVEITLA
jgi:hypothetical protein